MTTDLCPCGSTKEYAVCCEPVILGQVLAATPADLMRSRYSAYAKQKISWLLNSLEPTQRADFDEKAVSEWSAQSEWLGLQILRTQGGDQASDTKGFVEFIARFKQDGVARDHHELGEFRKIDNQWYFYDGRGVKPAPFKHQGPVIGRNDPCPCGSGKKHKKCCGA